MDWKKLDKNIQRSDGYRLFKKYRRLITFIEGIFIIGLLIGINMYFYQDWQIKKQIRERCGYTHNNWECVCTQEDVDFYKEERKGKINVTLDAARSINAQNTQNEDLAG